MFVAHALAASLTFLCTVFRHDGWFLVDICISPFAFVCSRCSVCMRLVDGQLGVSRMLFVIAVMSACVRKEILRGVIIGGDSSLCRLIPQ